MGAIASQITSLTIVYSSVYSDADQRKHQMSASLAFVRGIHWGTGEFPAQIQMASNAENVSIWWRHPDDTLGFSDDKYKFQNLRGLLLLWITTKYKTNAMANGLWHCDQSICFSNTSIKLEKHSHLVL